MRDSAPDAPWPLPELFTGGGTADRARNFLHADDATERDALLQAIGIRQRHQMRDVPLDLLRAWHVAVQHPGMTERIADPAAFACSQLRQGNLPPTERELERWAGAGTAHDDDRYFPPAEIDLERHAARLAQARELVGNDDRELIAYVLAGLEEGLEPHVALQEAATSIAQLRRPVAAVEEVGYGL
ncbi:MAG: hypothetical protein HC828_06640 [Blastochloris sp.]|nr:hypothetical protein [Blastochloris sp.]